MRIRGWRHHIPIGSAHCNARAGFVQTFLSEDFAAALDAVNSWLADELDRRDLQVRLVTPSSAKRVAIEFEQLAKRGRRVDWDWQDLFFRRVRYRDAWMNRPGFCGGLLV